MMASNNSINSNTVVLVQYMYEYSCTLSTRRVLIITIIVVRAFVGDAFVRHSHHQINKHVPREDVDDRKVQKALLCRRQTSHSYITDITVSMEPSPPYVDTICCTINAIYMPGITTVQSSTGSTLLLCNSNSAIVISYFEVRRVVFSILYSAGVLECSSSLVYFKYIYLHEELRVLHDSYNKVSYIVLYFSTSITCIV